MIGRSEIDLGRSIVDSSVMLSDQTNGPSRDNIDPTQIAVNPELLKVKSETQSPSIPIWESSNAEVYFSSPGLKKIVVWNCNPNDEDARKYPRFDALDPLPYHYYESVEEFEKARESYRAGVYPDRRFDINEYFGYMEENIASSDSEIVIFPGVDEGKTSATEETKAA